MATGDYIIYYSDDTKYSSAITVNAGEINQTSTSLKFIGKNASSYSEAISTNFLHLLENFANSNPPSNPIEGQLWFDTTTDSKKLRINDGTATAANWKPINGIYQQDEVPGAAGRGDIWVDTARAQLFLTLDGTNWTLVGPSYSSTLKTGSYPEQITDTFGNLHSVIKNYIDDEVIEIISPDSFTPQVKINGFTTVKPGLNLTSVNSAILNATAYAAQNIYVTSPAVGYISGNNFVRNDISNSINGTLNIKNGSLTVGINPTFRLTKEGEFTNSFINSAADGGNFTFQVLQDEVYNNILVINGTGNNRYVGINKDNPIRALDVVGGAYIDGALTVTNSIEVVGVARFAEQVTLSGNTRFFNTTTHVKGIAIGTSTDSTFNTPIIIPAVTSIYDIGTAAKKFGTVHAGVFQGALFGTATVASSLTSVSSWNMSGDIASSGFNYKGQAGTYTFVTEVQPSIVQTKPEVTRIEDNDELLVSVSTATFRNIPSAGGTGVGATFDIDRGPSSYEAVRIFSSGTDYSNSDVLTINGTYLGGVSPTNDITITLGASSGVNSLGSINTGSYVFSGDPVAGLARAKKSSLISDVTNYLVPPGAIMPYAGINPPTGWLLCDGAYIDKTDYPELFAAIGYYYGATTIATKFRLPDLKGRMVIGYDDMSNGFASSTGGAGRIPSATTPNLALVPPEGALAAVTGGNKNPQPVSTVTNFGGTITGVTTEVLSPFHAMNYIIKA